MLHQLVQEGMYGNEGTPRHILHPHGLPNFSKIVQSVVKFSNEFIEKDSVLGGVIGGLSIRPDVKKVLVLFQRFLVLALLINRSQLHVL